MEYILGGLGALCCGATIGGIGYGLYRCCNNNVKSNIDNEKQRLIEVLNKNGGNNIATEFQVCYTNMKQDTIRFNITLPLDYSKIKNQNIDKDMHELQDLKKIVIGLQNKQHKNNDNQFLIKAIAQRQPIYYNLSFTLSKSGEIKIISNGISNRYTDDNIEYNVDKMKKILQTLDECVWEPRLGLELPQDDFHDLVNKFNAINNNNYNDLFKQLCDKFSIAPFKARRGDDLVNGNREHCFNLTDIDTGVQNDLQSFN